MYLSLVVSSTEIRAQVDHSAFVSPMILHELNTSEANSTESRLGSDNNTQTNLRITGTGMAAVGQGAPIDTVRVLYCSLLHPFFEKFVARDIRN